MTSTGQVYPSLGTSVSAAPHSDNTWSGVTNIYTANATANNDTTHCAYITATSFDSPDQSYLLKASGFDFSAIPDGATINGVTCRIGAFYTTGQGTGSIDLLQLNDTSRMPTGTNQAATEVPLTGDYTTVITKGSSSDDWGCALDAAWVKDADFGVSIGVLATAANADVFVDFVTLEVEYTEAATPKSDSDAATATEGGEGTAEPPAQVVFDAVGPAGGGGAEGTSSPFTFTHVNSSADNAFVVGVTTKYGNANDVTAVSYGGVTIPYLTFRAANDSASGGIALYARAGGLGGLPTGSNNVSISFSDTDEHLAGSVSASGAGALGTAVTNAAGSVSSVSVNVADTQSGGLVVAVACHGAMGTWSGNGCTLRFSRDGTAESGSNNVGGGTVASVAGTTSPGFSHQVADWWGIAAVEIKPPVQTVAKSSADACGVSEAAGVRAFVASADGCTATEAGSVSEVTGGPPQVVTYTHTAFTGTGSQNSADQISWAAGDLIVVIGGDENGQPISAPAATGLSFAALGTQIGTAGSACGAHVWVAAPSAPGGPATVSGTGASGNRWGFGIWVLREWTARTRTNGTVDTGQTVSVSRSGSHSLVLAGLFDWSAGDQTGSWTPAGANVRDQNLASGYYGWFVGDWPDQGDPGTGTYGVSVSSTGEFTKVCVEVAGTAGTSGPSAGVEAARVSEAGTVRAALGTAEAARVTEAATVTAFIASTDAAQASEAASTAESGGGEIALDASTPPVAYNMNHQAGPSVTTASFSPPANALLVAVVACGYTTWGGSTASVEVSDSGTHSWSPRVTHQDPTYLEDWAGIYTCQLTDAPGSITVTAHNTDTANASDIHLTVRVLTGAAASQAGAATGYADGDHDSGADVNLEVVIVTTTAGSWVFVAEAMKSYELDVLAYDANTTIIDWQTDSYDYGMTLASGKQTDPTGTPGSTTLGFKIYGGGDFYSAVALEILPGGGEGPVAKSDADAARVTEAGGTSAALSAPEAARVTEGQSLTARISSSGSARASEAGSVGTVLTVSTDAARVTEAQSTSATLSAAESARGSDAQGLTGHPAGTDAATAAEAASTSAAAASADAARASEAASVGTVLVTGSEAARATEAASLIASLSSLDTAQVSEAGSISGQSVASAEAARAAETAATRATLGSADAAQASDGNEGGTGGGVAFSADSARATESQLVTASLTTAEAAQAVQASEILRVPASEAAALTEAALVSSRTLADTEAATVAEAAAVSAVAVSSSEPARAAETAAVTAYASGTDQVTVSDDQNVRAYLTGADQVQAQDGGEAGGGTTVKHDADTWHIEDSGFWYLSDSDAAACAEGEAQAVGSTERGQAAERELSYWPVAADGVAARETEHAFWSGSLSSADAFTVTEGGEAIAPWHLSDTDAFAVTEHPVTGEDTPYIHLLTFAPTVREVFGGFLITAAGRPVLFSPVPTRQFLELAWHIHRSTEVRFVSAADRSAAWCGEQAEQCFTVAIVLRPALDVALEVS